MPAKKKTDAADDGQVEIKFNGEPHHKLVVDGETIWGSTTGKVSAARADELVNALWANVTLADKKTPQWPKDDDKLAAIAEKHSVELPAVPSGGGMPEPTTADKIAALEAAGLTPADA